MKADLSNFSGWVIYEKGKIVATYDKENFHRYYDQEEIRILQQRIDKAIEYINKLLKEETIITDENSIDYGEKCQRAYFSDSELIKILEILGDKENVKN